MVLPVCPIVKPFSVALVLALSKAANVVKSVAAFRMTPVVAFLKAKFDNCLTDCPIASGTANADGAAVTPSVTATPRTSV